jgi:hypothetical protein
LNVDEMIVEKALDSLGYFFSFCERLWIVIVSITNHFPLMLYKIWSPFRRGTHCNPLWEFFHPQNPFKEPVYSHYFSSIWMRNAAILQLNPLKSSSVLIRISLNQ